MNRNDQEILHSVQTDQSTHLPGILTLLSQSWRMFTSRPLLFLGMGFIAALVTALPTVTNITTVSTGPSTNLWNFLFIVMINVLIAAIQASIAIPIIYAIKDNLYHETGFAAAYRRACKIVFSSLWVSVLSTTIIFIVTLLLIAPVFALGAVWEATILSLLGSTMVTLLTSVLIIVAAIPGTVLFIQFLFAQYILVHEQQYGTKALEQSKHYVTDYWWKIFWRVVGLLIITSPLLLLSRYSNSVTVEFVLKIFFTPFSTIYLYLLYLHLKQIRAFNQPETHNNSSAADTIQNS